MCHIELNRAIYQKLILNQLLKNMGVYFDLPTQVKLPYIYIGNSIVHNISGSEHLIYNITSDVSLFSEDNINNHSLIVVEEIINTLNRDNIKLINFNLIDIKMVGYKTSKSTNGDVFELKITFKSFLERIS